MKVEPRSAAASRQCPRTPLVKGSRIVRSAAVHVRPRDLCGNQNFTARSAITRPCGPSSVGTGITAIEQAQRHREHPTTG